MVTTIQVIATVVHEKGLVKFEFHVYDQYHCLVVPHGDALAIGVGNIINEIKSKPENYVNK